MSERQRAPSRLRTRAVRFVVLFGVVSFFADFTYEGSRSIVGPYLALLGASAFLVATVTGFGELLGYGLRIVSGRLSDRSGRYWPITIAGYIVQMAAVPLLAIAGRWQIAALLVMAERTGKATRNPPRDAMIAHAGREMGFGWAFGLHEALDQAGALAGPLVVAAILAVRHNYKTSFEMLLVPAVLTVSLVVVARLLYPRPIDLEVDPPDVRAEGLPRIFWLYLAGAVLVAAGFADFPFIAYHLARTAVVKPTWIPVLYAIAMGVGAIGSLILGRLFDRRGISILIPLTIVGAVFAPLVFLGGFTAAVVGVALWGLGMGVHESIIPAAVAPMVSSSRRASAYGLFTAGYGIFWFLGSVVIGALYDVSVHALVAFAVAAELAATPFFLVVRNRSRPHES
jgi:predicted MFS family arabinose efflux permease